MNPKQWIIQLLIALDQVANMLITPLSSGAWADESMSCRCYRMHRDGKPWGRLLMPVIDKVFGFLQRIPNHCETAYLHEQQRYNMPAEFRTPELRKETK
jgi:hypothetical protein